MKARTLHAFLVALLLLSTATRAHAEEAPFRYEPLLAKRISYSQVVCAATIVSTRELTTTRNIDFVDRGEHIADAVVDSVFKGSLQRGKITFKYYDEAAHPAGDYFGPPTAFFKQGARYLIFLDHVEDGLEVAVPVFGIEIELGPASPAGSGPRPSLPTDIAGEIFSSIRAAPETIGRNASHYFSWAEELVDRDAIPAVETFLDSDSGNIRYDAAWWLSFRRLSESVLQTLTASMTDPDVGESARTEAARRLQDIRNGR